MNRGLNRVVLIVVALLLGVPGLCTLMTGVPFPTWHIESLISPSTVREITETQIILQDGRRVVLPLIKQLPHQNPLFLASVSDGIEISPNGEVYGLMWIDRICGLDPVVWKRCKTNLSCFAAAIHPDGVDETRLTPEVIGQIREYKRVDTSSFSRSHRNLHLSGYDFLNLRSIQRYFESTQVNYRPQDNSNPPLQ